MRLLGSFTSARMPCVSETTMSFSAFIAAATARTESRGSHYRGDFPARNDAEWLTNLFATRAPDGTVRLEKKWIGVGWIDQPGDVRIKPWG